MSDVREYYDRNTRSFLRFGKGQTRAIHRAIKTPGVRTTEEAYHVVEELILRELRRVVAHEGDLATDTRGGVAPRDGDKRPLVADLGCGVGASIDYLSHRVAARFVGITLSEVQAAIAERAIGPVHRVVAGDFTEEAPYEELLNGRLLAAAYLIESWNHASDPSSLLARITEHTQPGSILAICDDIPREHLFTPGAVTARDQRLVAEFRRGWHVKTFLPATAIAELASGFGFDLLRCEDLSGSVVLDRPRDRIVRLLAGVARRADRDPNDGSGAFRGAMWDNIRGGDALQQLEKRGLMSYQLCLFRRV